MHQISTLNKPSKAAKILIEAACNIAAQVGAVTPYNTQLCAETLSFYPDKGLPYKALERALLANFPGHVRLGYDPGKKRDYIAVTTPNSMKAQLEARLNSPAYQQALSELRGEIEVPIDPFQEIWTDTEGYEDEDDL